MADSPAKTITNKQPAAPGGARAAMPSTMSVLAPAIGWLIPGAGHLMQKRWIRGFLLMGSVVTMFVLGLLMQGRIYKPNGGGSLGGLGFVGGIGAGGRS